MILNPTRSNKQRIPLSTLDISPYLINSTSPKKTTTNKLNAFKSSPLKMTSTSSNSSVTANTSSSNDSLLPSPFFINPTSASTTTTTTERLPLNTLFESTNNNLNSLGGVSGSTLTASPRGMMALEERLIVQDDEDAPPTPPRRLMDAFLSSASKIRSLNGSASTSGNVSASGSGHGTSGASSPIASPASKRKEEEEASAWTFYEDSPQLTPRRRAQVNSTRMEVDSVERGTYSSGEEEDLPKENQRPSPRTLQLRSSNITLNSNLPPTSPHVHQPLSTPPHSRPTFLSISTDPGPRISSNRFRTTPPSSTNIMQPPISISAIFPSWSETSYATTDSNHYTNTGPTSPLLLEVPPSLFSEGNGHLATLDTSDSPEVDNGEFELPSSQSSTSLLARTSSSSSLLLLPGFALSPRKRSSTEGANVSEGGGDSSGSERKRGRRMGSEEASAVAAAGGGKRFLS